MKAIHNSTVSQIIFLTILGYLYVITYIPKPLGDAGWGKSRKG